jgi:hypothetical protein
VVHQYAAAPSTLILMIEKSNLPLLVAVEFSQLALPKLCEVWSLSP